MLRNQSVQVEVTIQDYFFANSSSNRVELITEFDNQTVSSEVFSAIAPAPILDSIWEYWFQCWLEHLHPDFSPTQTYELSLRLTDDVAIQVLNAQYRHKDQPTDVLAFAALEVNYPQWGESSLDLPLYLGDIVISVETAQRQAQEGRHSLKQELAWLATHGLLHLLGWDHPNEESLARMLDQQEILLQIVGIATPMIR
jgi:probable rRNA maturation factor